MRFLSVIFKKWASKLVEFWDCRLLVVVLVEVVRRLSLMGKRREQLVRVGARKMAGMTMRWISLPNSLIAPLVFDPPPWLPVASGISPNTYEPLLAIP